MNEKQVEYRRTEADAEAEQHVEQMSDQAFHAFAPPAGHYDGPQHTYPEGHRRVNRDAYDAWKYSQRDTDAINPDRAERVKHGRVNRVATRVGHTLDTMFGGMPSRSPHAEARRQDEKEDARI